MPLYQITPSDVLFFRDGRPMEVAVGSGGHGARWPGPSILFDALHAALHRAFPEHEDWEHRHDWARSSHLPYRGDGSQRFGSLATAGPFPCVGEAKAAQWLFRCPADAAKGRGCRPQLRQPLNAPGGCSNLPAPLLYPSDAAAAITKDSSLPWWSREALLAYLDQQDQVEEFWQRELWADEELYGGEWTTGIALDPATGTTGRGEAEGKIYSAQYLRLRDEVALGIHAIMPMQLDRAGEGKDPLANLFPSHRTIVVGGQQRTCQVQEIEHRTLGQLLPMGARLKGTRVKWVLLSPAVFPRIAANPAKSISEHPGGWLPTWIAPKDDFPVLRDSKVEVVQQGRVLLKKLLPRARSRRDLWRKEVRAAEFLKCRLVAACIPKPVVVTGWTERKHLLAQEKNPDGTDLTHGPRVTLLAVPAGAVYYFEADSEDDARALADALNWHGAGQGQTIANRRSTLMGEKGFGLGVCGPWNFSNAAAKPPAS